MNYSNPRMNAVIENWPLGRTRKCTATFVIEQNPKRGERAVRTTIGKPKALTFARKARIVDGDDGRTYIAELGSYSNAVSIMCGDMKFQKEYISENDPRHAQVLALFN